MKFDKTHFYIFISILFVLCLILFSNSALSAASRGIRLCIDVVIPSLLPFFIGSDILNRTGFPRSFGRLLSPVMKPLFNIPGSGSFALIMGIASGYPVGAKITADLYRQGLLCRGEAERLLAFSNNSGPLFIFGAVSVGMFGLPSLGGWFYLAHILACVTVGFLFGLVDKLLPSARSKTERYSGIARESGAAAKIQVYSVGSLLGESIASSIRLMAAVCGFIVLFSVIIELLTVTGAISLLASMLFFLLQYAGIAEPTLRAILSGFFEITTGVNLASHAQNVPLMQKIAASGAIIGWAGLSVHVQVISVVQHTGLSVKPYLLGKLLQAMLSWVYLVLLLKPAGLGGLPDLPAFGAFPASGIPSNRIFVLSDASILFLSVFAGMLLCLMAAGALKRRKKRHRLL